MINMINKTLLVIGPDRISRRLSAALPLHRDLIVVEDKSSTLGRVFKLIRRGSLPLGLVAAMFSCELRRKFVRARSPDGVIKRNADLVGLIAKYAPHRVVLFRAGLIINKSVLDLGVPIMNIHCARLPDFGGIGAIDRALHAQAYEQFATLHAVTEGIDSGTVTDIEPYMLDPRMSYCVNEERAYEAGQRLLFRTLEGLFKKTDRDSEFVGRDCTHC